MLHRTRNIKKNIAAFCKTKAKKMKIAVEGISHCKGVNRETTGTLSTRISKGKNDNLKRPNNNELIEHFAKDHDFAKNVDFTIL